MKSKPAKKKKKTAKAEPKKRSGSYDLALADYEKAIKQFQRKQYEQAKAQFEAMLEKHSVELEICERVRMYLRIIDQQLSPKKPRARNADDHYLLATLEHNAGEFQSAIDHCRKGLAASPEDDRFHFLMAAAMARAGQESEAIDALKEAVARNIDNLRLAIHDTDFKSLEQNPKFVEITHPGG